MTLVVASGCDVLADPGTTVRGQVLDEEDSRPVVGVGAALSVRTEPGLPWVVAQLADGVTDSDGRFVLIAPSGLDVPESTLPYVLTVGGLAGSCFYSTAYRDVIQGSDDEVVVVLQRSSCG